MRRTLRRRFLRLHRAWQAATDQLLSLTEGDGAEPIIAASPEAAVHNVFRRHRNHFRELEEAAERVLGARPSRRDEVYAALKHRLRDRLGITVRLVPGRGPARHAAPV